ncbi:MAG: hypothetical protein JWO55_333 [Candidatus Saccharibacteria bacterium]|jgi:hypothetical protein|nr:hypothetical protein [Candidatus Saccharibacteria bacterium]
MGFFDGLRKMIEGKPVFEDSNKPRADVMVNASDQFDLKGVMPTDEPPEKVRIEAPQQTKVTPTFDLRHCQTHINGDSMTVTIWATNTSSVDIEIDKCVILDTKTEIDRRLSPGQAHEIMLYKGPIPKSDHAHTANIFYKSIRENEYFRVDFMVEYNREPDGSYIVEDLHPEHYAIKELT